MIVFRIASQEYVGGKVSLGLRLLAQLSEPSEPEQFLDRIEGWVQSKYSNMRPRTRQDKVEDVPTLFCVFHPAAEEVELTVVTPHQLVVYAKTSTVGPGYHMFLTEMLQALANDFQVSWEQPQESSDDYGDETDYFFSGEENKLFDAMAEWLQAVANTFFEEPLRPEDRGIALCMPMDPHFEVDETATTPLGPRDRDWLFKTSKDGQAGKDFFAWWAPGFNAEYYLGRALVQMWSNVRWRAPISEAETDVITDVAESLRAAYRLNLSLAYPWAEWQEVLALLGEDGEEAELVRSRVANVPSIGYRRKPVSVGLPGGWRMRVPGSFSEFEPDEESNFCALDPPREVWFTSYRFNAPSARETFESNKKRMKEEQPEYLTERDDYVAKASIGKKRRESGEEYFVLNGSNVGLRQRAVCTIVFSQAEEKELALGIWRSIEPPPDQEKPHP